jgi:hypothetical protein
MPDVTEQRATEIAALTEQLAGLKHEMTARGLREQIAEHAALLAPPVREWHRIEFLSAGKRKAKVAADGALLVGAGAESTEYHPQDVVAEGYLVIEDGEVVAVVDRDGKPIADDAHPAPEHRVRAVLQTSPFPTA